MTKRTKWLYVIGVLIICVLIALMIYAIALGTPSRSSAAEVPPCDEHDFGDWEQLIPPTCGEGGVHGHQCKICGRWETRRTPQTYEHELGEWEVVTPSTCGDAGIEQRRCTICGRAETRNIPPTGNHDFDKNGKCRVCGRDINDPDIVVPPGGDVPGGSTPGGNLPGGDLPGGDAPGGSTPGGDLPGGTPTPPHPGTDIPDDGGDVPSGTVPGLDTSGSLQCYPSEKQTAMRIWSEIDDTVYLRFMNFGDYAGNKWLQAEEYEGRLMANYGFAYLPGMQFSSNRERAYHMAIRTFSTQYLLPYYLALGNNYSYAIQSSDVRYSGPTDAIYDLAYYSYGYLENGIPTGDPLPVYAQLERQYRSFVYENYLQIPASTAEFFSELILQQGFSARDPKIFSKVAQFIQKSATYNQQYNHAMDDEQDIIVAFLSKYKEGVCQHYASAATLLFRALGIPARYVTGYVGNSRANEWTDISTENAHAWVEVYIDNFGWMQIEVTGAGADGTFDGSEIPDYDNPGGGKPQEKIAITVRSKSLTKVYDGMPFEDSDLLETVNGLLSGHYISNCYRMADANVGIMENVITNVLIYDQYDNDVTDWYEISYEYGLLEITRRQITVTTGSAEKKYDGTPLTCWECTVTAGELVSGEYIRKVEYTGSRTERGRCENGISSIKIYDAYGNDVTQNYAITVINGTLRVF